MIRNTAGSAITILNAIKSNHGAAMGIQAKIGTEISVADKLIIQSSSDELLINSCIHLVENEFGISIDKIKIHTFSELPPSRGMKTSSSISCTTIEALLRYYHISVSKELIIHMGAKASINAGVSITGAIDDAYASYLGGMAFTDNSSGQLVYHKKIPSDLVELGVLLLIPAYDNPKSGVMNELEQIDSNLINQSLESMKKGEILAAIEWNTNAYAPLLLRDPNIVDELRSFGLETVGLNGAGPSLFALMKPDKMTDAITNINNSFPDLRLVRSSFRDLQ